jgi:hypothetical protein
VTRTSGMTWNLNGVSDMQLEMLTDSVPEDWISSIGHSHRERVIRQSIGDGLKRLRDAADSLHQRLREIGQVLPETPEEERLRLERNKQVFQRRFGSF